MNALVYLLALVGVIAVLAVVGVWLLIPPDATDDVEVRDRLAPYTGHGHARVHAVHDPASCEACAGIDRGSF